MGRSASIAHLATVILMAAAVLVATGDGFAQSYAGLLRWAGSHHLTGWRRDSFPLLVDLFILVGELGLFALALEGHRLTRRALAWTDLALPAGIAVAGWTVSLVFNIGAAHHDVADRTTAAVPPVAAMLGLLVLLRTLHRLVRRGSTSPVETVAADQDAPVVVEQACPGLYEGPAWWPSFVHLDQVPTTPPSAVARMVEDRSRNAVDGAVEAPVFDHPQPAVVEHETTGQERVVDLASAVRSAKAAGLSEREIADRFGTKRYRVRKILKEPAVDPISTSNGHPVDHAAGLVASIPGSDGGGRSAEAP